MKRVAELDGEPEVGKFYLVPCILYRGEWTPTFGPAHDDADYIGGAAAARHYHLDARFLNDRFLSTHFHDTDRRLRRRGKPGLDCTPAEFAMQLIPQADALFGEPREQRLKCKRRMPDFPLIVRRTPAPWLPTLERVYADASAKCGRCPHRGMNLKNLPVKDGKVICNGHGLQFDVATGALVPRDTEAR